MSNNKNQPALTLQECLSAADETKEFVLKQHAFLEIPSILKHYFRCTGVCLVADEHTYTAAGKTVLEILDNNQIKVVDTHFFPGEPRLHAEYAYVTALISHFSALPDYKNIVPIAIGSGTINDLVKRASFEIGLPYLCIPTAASVDGYTANGAALLMDGFKQTLPCTAPRVVIADTDVLSHAPAYLSSSGFGDLASKIIAGTDWIIAAKAGALGAPGAEPISEKAWAMTQNGLLDTLKRSVNAAYGDSDAVHRLFEALAITGFAMQYLKNSRPVSGSEHLFSHVWEMDDLSVQGIPVTHGHKVTLGTLAATAFTEVFFADPKGPPEVPKDFRRPSPKEREAEVFRAFQGNTAQQAIVKTGVEKLMDDTQVKLINTAFRDSWKDIRDQVLDLLVPYRALKDLLSKAGCPVQPEIINLTRTELIATARRAQMMRNKYGILDLAWDMGNFETILSCLETSEYYFR